MFLPGGFRSRPSYRPCKWFVNAEHRHARPADEMIAQAKVQWMDGWSVRAACAAGGQNSSDNRIRRADVTRRGSGCGFRVEPGDQVDELPLEGRLIVLWMTADEARARGDSSRRQRGARHASRVRGRGIPSRACPGSAPADPWPQLRSPQAGRHGRGEGPVEGRLIAMEHVPDLTLVFLNEATQAAGLGRARVQTLEIGETPRRTRRRAHAAR